MSEQRKTNYWAVAPFGRIGHALGWRWVFYFTFPIPYHPWLARALPLLILAWIGWLAVGPGGVDWHGPLWAALILAVPLSIPFLQWILFAFRLHLIQALMLPAALLLLGGAALRREVPIWLVSIPFLYFGGVAVTAAAGRMHIRRWRSENAKIDLIPAKHGPLPPILLRGPSARRLAGGLVERLSLPSLHFEEKGTAMEVLRICDPALIAWLEKIQYMNLDLFQMSYGSGRERRLVHLRADQPVDPWILEPAPTERPRFIHGEVGAARATLGGEPSLTYWHGRPAPLSFLAGFYFLIRLQLGMTAVFQPEYGFLPATPRPLGNHSQEEGAYAALAGALSDEGELPLPFADPDALRARIQALVDRHLEPELSALDRLIASPATWMDRRLDTLLRLPQLYTDRAEELVEALRVARDAEHRPSAILLAQLIAALPADAYQRIGDPLILVMRSKLLAGRIVFNDLELGQEQEPPFDGFRLVVHVPKLYERLGELGERARPLIEGLVKHLPHIKAVQKAMAKLGQHGSAP